MNARELLEKLEYENRNGLRWLFSSDSEDRKTVLRALSLLASVEDGEGIVRELREDAHENRLRGRPEHARTNDEAAARIVALEAQRDEARELAAKRGEIQVRLQSELASVKAHAESMAEYIDDNRESSGAIAKRAYRAAHPETP